MWKIKLSYVEENWTILNDVERCGNQVELMWKRIERFWTMLNDVEIKLNSCGGNWTFWTKFSMWKIKLKACGRKLNDFEQSFRCGNHVESMWKKMNDFEQSWTMWKSRWTIHVGICPGEIWLENRLKFTVKILTKLIKKEPIFTSKWIVRNASSLI